jgi:FMN phosphatase YigB (HAD superfamily)/predicted kinase
MPARHPLLLAMSGSVASGKSMLARALAARLGALRIEGDRVRDDLLESSRDPVHEAQWARAFTPIFEEQVYAELLRRADRELERGRAVVIDACFPRNSQRLRARSIARARGAAFLLVEAGASAAVVEARLAERDTAAGRAGWRSIHDALAARVEPILELAPDEHVTAPTGLPLEAAIAAVLEAPCVRAALADLGGAAERARPDAVTFDCWNTLLYEEDWQTAHARRVEALLAVARESGAEVTRERAAVAFDAAWEQHMRLWSEGVATGAPEVARWALAGVGLRDPHPGLERLIASFQGASHSSRVLALDDARETLAALVERGVRCALVCDTGLTPGSVVRGHLARLGLLDSLDVQAFSDEVGYPKPDPRAFRAALAPLGIPPERALHVGDLRRTDVAGARALGMTTVRISARHDDGSELPDADHVVASHAELREWLTLEN